MKHWQTAFLLVSAFCALAGDITGVSVFPACYQRNAMGVTENYPYAVIVKFNGNPAKLRSTPPEFVIELPAQIRLLYASTRIFPNKTIPFREEFDGKVRRCRMTLPCGKIHIAPKGSVWSGGFYLYLQAEKGSAGQTAEIRHFFEHKGERVVPGSFRLSVLPELGKAKNHFRDFLFSVHEFSSAGHEDTSILKERLDFWTSFTTGKKIYQFVGWSSYRLPEKSRELLKKYCK